MATRATHPRTGTVYRFPRDAKRYRALVERLLESKVCDYGHFDCAGWDGGPCMNEVEGHIRECVNCCGPLDSEDNSYCTRCQR